MMDVSHYSYFGEQGIELEDKISEIIKTYLE